MSVPQVAKQTDSDMSEAGPTSRTRSSPHPRYALEQVEELAQHALAMGARHVLQDSVAQAVGYKNAGNGAFRGLRAAGGYFGVLTYQDDKHMSVTEPWIRALHDASDEERIMLRRQAVSQPDLYRQLIKEFNDRQLLPAEKLAQQLFLSPKYGILKDAAETAAKTFLASIRFARLVDGNNFLRTNTEPDPASSPTSSIPPSGSAPEFREQAAPANSPPASNSLPQTLDGLDRIEVQLARGRRAYLLVPVPITAREKDRLKKYIDLILEPEEDVPDIS